MFKLAVLATTLLICFGSFACQSYSTGLQQSVARADETAATAALRAIAVAQQTYAISNDGHYGSFPQLSEGGYLDARFNSEKPAIKDYVLTMEVGSGSTGPYYRSNADPIGTGPQAGRHFYMDSTSNALHVNQSQTASADDPTTQP
jgi:type II secretory pathway pseudopilin PulG